MAPWINGVQMWNPQNAQLIHKGYPLNVDKDKLGIQLFFKGRNDLLGLLAGL